MCFQLDGEAPLNLAAVSIHHGGVLVEQSQ